MRDQHVITFMFDLIMMISLLIIYRNFIQIIDKNSMNNKNLNWILEGDNFRTILKISDLTMPFVIFKALDVYFTVAEQMNLHSEYLAQQTVNGMWFPYVAMAIFCLTVLVIMYFCYRFLISKKWIKNYEIEVDSLFREVYQVVFSLDILVFDIKNVLAKFNKRISYFIKTLKVNFLIRFNTQKSMFLLKFKKATAPPNLLW